MAANFDLRSTFFLSLKFDSTNTPLMLCLLNALNRFTSEPLFSPNSVVQLLFSVNHAVACDAYRLITFCVFQIDSAKHYGDAGRC